ncbi:YjgB family protein [Clostridium perfringens]
MKKIISILLIIISMTTLVGCNFLNKNNSASENSEKISDNKSSENEDNKSSENEDNNKSNKSVNNKSNVKNDNKSNVTNKSNNESNLDKLMEKIKEYAIKGEVINSNFKLGDSIGNVIDKLGKPSNESYVEAAKGDYFTFDSKNLVFGCNKGEQIFEIRCLENNLNNLNLNDIENFFGKPNYSVTTKLNEKIIGYKISKNFKILFVFDNKNTKLKHYSVLCPELTKNSMAGYKAREW